MQKDHSLLVIFCSQSTLLQTHCKSIGVTHNVKTIIKSTELLFNGLGEQVVHVERDKLCSEACSGSDVIRYIHSACTAHMAATYVFCSLW